MREVNLTTSIGGGGAAALKRMSRWIGTVAGYAWLPALILSGVSAYYAHENFSLQVQRDAFAKQVREDLGNFERRGVMLLIQCVRTQNPSPEAEVNEWNKQLDAYIHRKLGDAYRARLIAFHDPPGFSVPTVSGDRENFCRSLAMILGNLDAIVSEFSGR